MEATALGPDWKTCKALSWASEGLLVLAGQWDVAATWSGFLFNQDKRGFQIRGQKAEASRLRAHPQVEFAALVFFFLKCHFEFQISAWRV